MLIFMIKHYTALSTINAPRSRKMTVADLRQALAAREVAERWRSHLQALFEEVSPDSAEQIVKAEQLDAAALLALVPLLRPHENAVAARLAVSCSG
jgi:hypothetical protein